MHLKEGTFSCLEKSDISDCFVDMTLFLTLCKWLPIVSYTQFSYLIISLFLTYPLAYSSSQQTCLLGAIWFQLNILSITTGKTDRNIRKELCSFLHQSTKTWDSIVIPKQNSMRIQLDRIWIELILKKRFQENHIVTLLYVLCSCMYVCVSLQKFSLALGHLS